MTSPQLTIDDQICFALYSASRALTGRYREFLAPLGVTYPQYLVLLALWESEPLTVSALGERLHLDSGTVSPLLRRLTAAGLVDRRRAATDERAVEVRLTDAGRALQEQAAGIPAQVCSATGLEPSELVTLRGQIATLAEHVRTTAP